MPNEKYRALRPFWSTRKCLCNTKNAGRTRSVIICTIPDLVRSRSVRVHSNVIVVSPHGDHFALEDWIATFPQSNNVLRPCDFGLGSDRKVKYLARVESKRIRCTRKRVS